MTQEQITLLRAIPIEDLASRLGLDVRHHKALASSATPTATPSTSSATSSTKTSNKPASTSPTAP